MSFTLTEAAKRDLIDIGIQTQEKWGKRKRLRYLQELDSAFSLLAKFPNMGTSCNHYREGYRKHPCGSHVIFYTQESHESILIIRVLHSAMLPESYL